MNRSRDLGLCRRVVLAVLLGAIATVAEAEASRYSITDLGGGGNQAYAINNRGQIAGVLQDPAHPYGAFVSGPGGSPVTPLGTLGGGDSLAYGMNDAGQVVGMTGTPQSARHAFLYTDGRMTDLGALPGADYSIAFDINASGQVAGYAATGGLSRHAFLVTDGRMTDLGTLPGADSSYAYAINDAGQVVGDSGNHAFVAEGGVMRELSTLGGTRSSAANINEAGQIVGAMWGPSGPSRAFLDDHGVIRMLGGSDGYALGINDVGQVVGYSDGRAFLYDIDKGLLTDLNSLLPADSPWVLELALRINNAGQIVGTGRLNGENRAFLMTPSADPDPPTQVVPEPTTLALLILGVLAAGTRLGLRRRHAASAAGSLDSRVG